MILSFPIGTFLVFNSELGEEINYDYPISGFDFLLSGIGVQVPIEFELGDGFIVLWSVYLIIFSISILGPQKDFVRTLSPIISEGEKPLYTNYMITMIRWFSILILVSVLINFVQEGFGIITEAPFKQNNLIQFFDVSKAPLIEEIGFRVLLIGIPLFAFYSHRFSIGKFFKTLWFPYAHLHTVENKRAVLLIIVVAVFFGLAHIISGDSWSSGKFVQASASGVIIGWVYFRYGLAPALLIHWSTNYFIFSYVYFIAEINLISVKEAFSHSFIGSLEILFVITGIISLILMIVSSQYLKREKKLEI